MKNGFKLIQIEPELTLWFIKRLIRLNQGMKGWWRSNGKRWKRKEGNKMNGFNHLIYSDDFKVISMLWIKWFALTNFVFNWHSDKQIWINL